MISQAIDTFYFVPWHEILVYCLEKLTREHRQIRILGRNS